MFGKRKKRRYEPTFDKTGKVPTIRASICTGEQVAGFKDPVTQHFTELMLIRTREDLEEFLEMYDVNEQDIKREW